MEGMSTGNAVQVRAGRRGLVLLPMLLLLTGVVARPALAADAPFVAGAVTGPAKWDGDAYKVSAFDVKYANERGTGLPSAGEFRGVSIQLGIVAGEYVVPPKLERKYRTQSHQTLPENYRPRTVLTESFRFEDLTGGTTRVYRLSALWAIGEQLQTYLNTEKKLIGIYVAPNPAQINPEPKDGHLEDLRKPDDTRLTYLVEAGVVTDVRTVASGQRLPASETRINNKIHKSIRDNSPVQPSASSATSQPSGAAGLRRDLLDDYIFRLNRHPGRHVDVAVSAASEKDPGQVVLDYLVSETKAWSIYAQVSNTGTKQTDEWRERFGYVTDQLTNHDDILSIDYTTAGFTKSHNVNISYEAPFSTAGKLRYKVFGTYQQFTASDVGFSRENFSGEEFLGGGELAFNLYQRRDLFLDAVGGVRYEHVRVSNGNLGQSGTADFIVPYVGLRFERNAEISTTLANVTFQGRFTGANQDSLNRLGRLDTSSDAYLVQADATHSFFLEPILDRRAFDEARGTLAHEVALSVRAQYTFSDSRLIPQAEEVAGGFYSVRGYPESIVSGDSVIVGSAEYRFHIPRAFAPREEQPKTILQRFLGSDFRVVPTVAYGRPDWDVIVRGFFDAGRTFNNKASGFENDQTLFGAGVGFELQLRQNFNVRVDYGIPLNSIAREVTAGSGRVHVSATILY